MKKYKARIADKILKKRLLGKGAVLIEGQNGAEKQRRLSRLPEVFFICRSRKRTTKSYNGRNQSGETSERKKPRLLDEWQIAPKLWMPSDLRSITGMKWDSLF